MREQGVEAGLPSTINTPASAGDYLIQRRVPPRSRDGAAGTLYLQQNGTDDTVLYRHLVVDNGQESSSSAVIEEATLNMAGPHSSSAKSYTTYGGVTIATSGSPYHTSYQLSNLFNSNSNPYITYSSATITVSFPFAVFAKAVTVTPVCSG